MSNPFFNFKKKDSLYLTLYFIILCILALFGWRYIVENNLILEGATNANTYTNGSIVNVNGQYYIAGNCIGNGNSIGCSWSATTSNTQTVVPKTGDTININGTFYVANCNTGNANCVASGNCAVCTWNALPSDTAMPTTAMPTTSIPTTAMPTTAGPTPSYTFTPTPSYTLTPTPSYTLTPTPSYTFTPTPSPSYTATPSATNTSLPKVTNNLGEDVTKVVGSIGDGIDKVTGSVGKSVDKVVGTGGNAINGVISTTGGVVGNIIDSLGRGIGKLLSSIGFPIQGAFVIDKTRRKERPEKLHDAAKTQTPLPPFRFSQLSIREYDDTNIFAALFYAIVQLFASIFNINMIDLQKIENAIKPTTPSATQKPVVCPEMPEKEEKRHEPTGPTTLNKVKPTEFTSTLLTHTTYSNLMSYPPINYTLLSGQNDQFGLINPEDPAYPIIRE